jgi:hypothetical protein
MPLTCNIDAKGKFVRLIYGLVLIVVAVVLLILWAVPSETFLSWLVTVVSFLGGAFALFEARAGWCVVRAMGIKTPV